MHEMRDRSRILLPLATGTFVPVADDPGVSSRKLRALHKISTSQQMLHLIRRMIGQHNPVSEV